MSSTKRKPSASTPGSKGAFKPHEVVLDNGLRAFLLERPGLPVVASTIWYRVGSRDEKTGQTGCSHLLEHMMFKGTERYAKGEIDRVTSRMGGSNNAFTDHDTTAYWFALAADRWETALEIEADRMVHNAFDPDEFAAEKNVVLEELAMYDDEPWNRLWTAGEALAYQVHPYHHPIIGWKEDLERLTVDGLRAYYERHYGPDRAFLVVVGAIDVVRTEARIRECFGHLEPVGPRDGVLAEPDPRGPRRAQVRTPGSTVRLAMAAPGARSGSARDFALDVLAHALAGGRSGRLYQELVIERELATGVSVHNEARLDRGPVWFLVELRPGVDPDLVEEIVYAQLDEVGRRGLKPAEFRRVRAQILSNWMFEEETVIDLALRIGRFESVVAEGHSMIERVPVLYEAVDNDAIREAVRDSMRPEQFTVVEGVPEEGAPVRRRSEIVQRELERRSRGAQKATRKPSARKPAKKAAAKAGKKAPAKAAANKTTGRKKTSAKKAATKAKKAATRKAPGKKAPGKKAPGKKAPATKATRAGKQKGARRRASGGGR
jgi:zinc protease